MDMSALGTKIKQERKQQGLTLEILSEKLGISRNFLWEIEAGRKSPALPTLYNLAITLNISVDYLLGLSEKNRHLNDPAHTTERDLELSRIIKEISGYGIKELLLVSNIIRDCSKYFEQF